MRLFLLICLLIPVNAFSDVYKYQNADGVTVYVTDPSEVPTEFRDQVQRPHDLPQIMKSDYKGYDDVIVKGKAPKKNVEIYVTSWCEFCAKTEQFLRANNVRFKKYDIEKSNIGKQKHAKAGGGGVPVIKVGNTVIRGFDEQRLRKELGL